jgi:hypothetical protein
VSILDLLGAIGTSRPAYALAGGRGSPPAAHHLNGPALAAQFAARRRTAAARRRPARLLTI